MSFFQSKYSDSYVPLDDLGDILRDEIEYEKFLYEIDPLGGNKMDWTRKNDTWVIYPDSDLRTRFSKIHF